MMRGGDANTAVVHRCRQNEQNKKTVSLNNSEPVSDLILLAISPILLHVGV